MVAQRRAAENRNEPAAQLHEPRTANREPNVHTGGHSRKPNAPHRKAPTIAQADDPAPDPANPTP